MNESLRMLDYLKILSDIKNVKYKKKCNSFLRK